jgi:glycerol-3-phosphate dehydrogenase
VNNLIQQLQRDYAFVDAAWAHSLIRRYGKRAWNMLGNAQTKADLGQDFGATLSEREIGFLQVEEWAYTAEDILWRRSKIGLHMSAAQRQAVSDWLAAQGANA